MLLRVASLYNFNHLPDDIYNNVKIFSLLIGYIKYASEYWLKVRKLTGFLSAGFKWKFSITSVYK